MKENILIVDIILDLFFINLTFYNLSQLIKRSEIFNNNNNILFYIQDFQDSMYEDDDEYFETQDDKISFQEQFDARTFSTSKVKLFYKKISICNTDIENHSSKLSESLFPMLNYFNVKELNIISHLKMNLLGANLKHKYLPVKKATASLKKILGSKNYEEAIKIDILELHQFIDIFFWLERCDASIPEFVFFHDILDRFSFSLCKDGNIHLTEYDKKIFTKEILKKYKWRVVKGRCENTFSETSKIEHRITNIRF